MTRKAYLVISGTIFGLVASLHLIRIIFRVPVHIGDWPAPFSISWGGFIAATFLCAWAVRLFIR